MIFSELIKNEKNYLSRSEGNKVLYSQRCNLSEKPNHNPANFMSSYGDIKKYLQVGRSWWQKNKQTKNPPTRFNEVALF